MFLWWGPSKRVWCHWKLIIGTPSPGKIFYREPWSHDKFSETFVTISQLCWCNLIHLRRRWYFQENSFKKIRKRQASFHSKSFWGSHWIKDSTGFHCSIVSIQTFHYMTQQCRLWSDHSPGFSGPWTCGCTGLLKIQRDPWVLLPKSPNDPAKFIMNFNVRTLHERFVPGPRIFTWTLHKNVHESSAQHCKRAWWWRLQMLMGKTINARKTTLIAPMPLKQPRGIWEICDTKLPGSFFTNMD